MSKLLHQRIVAADIAFSVILADMPRGPENDYLREQLDKLTADLVAHARSLITEPTA